MSNFKTPLVVSPLPDGRRWKLHTKFVHELITSELRLLITVEAGFITDFASVPWPFWSLIRPWGRWGKAAVLHDWLYRHQYILLATNVPTPISRQEADLLFFGAMGELGVAPWRRNLMYWAVRAFGWLAWRKKR